MRISTNAHELINTAMLECNFGLPWGTTVDRYSKSKKLLTLPSIYIDVLCILTFKTKQDFRLNRSFQKYNVRKANYFRIYLNYFRLV